MLSFNKVQFIILTELFKTTLEIVNLLIEKRNIQDHCFSPFNPRTAFIINDVLNFIFIRANWTTGLKLLD
ncbi:hypothetical protein BpHYR1_010048 [Brachionus plicatilis]|uniref:Uncharacterized protein n=1 Tax=Brachionus plicatilis TaxID=10195 RepID=A0A3M7R919_BRAPC|nr:hypothetical protein BpHYR1_010048 [Brachionus plicatilis]